MICFDIYVNGEKVCRAGKNDLQVLSCILSWVKPGIDDQELALSVGGLYIDKAGGNVHPDWSERLNLNVGDEVTIKIVEADTADEPIGETIEPTEFAQEEKRKFYEILKTEFENDSN